MPINMKKSAKPVFAVIMHVDGDIHVDYHSSARSARKQYKRHVNEMENYATSHGLEFDADPVYASFIDGSADVGMYA